MRIPYVINNETHRLAEVLNAILAEHRGDEHVLRGNLSLVCFDLVWC